MEDKKEDTNYELVEIPTQHGLAIKKPSGEVISTEMAVVEILNIVKRIETSVA
jgi:hypothetical protein